MWFAILPLKCHDLSKSVKKIRKVKFLLLCPSQDFKKSTITQKLEIFMKKRSSIFSVESQVLSKSKEKSMKGQTQNSVPKSTYF